jgi:phenylalanyl-tRNA synthetase beta chain
MLISKNWLEYFINLEDKSAQEIADKLTLSTLEIEGYEDQAENLENMVVGEIKEIKDHPDADNLEICMTDIGDELVQIICGGSNIEEGLKVAVAKIEAKVRWHGEGELVELEETEIRGEKSRGMIAAANEIGLEDNFPMENEKEILDLSNMGAEVGADLAQAVGQDDVIFEIDNKSMSRRPDLWGHYGIARELTVLFDRELKDYDPKEIDSNKQNKLEIEVKNKNLANRYMAVSLSDVEVKESPQWLKDKLQAVDIESVNNIVDITNFVLMELGQPMHAFDRSKLASNKIIVRNAQAGEKITTLDDSELELSEKNLVIADEEKPIALAGIIGAKNSQVDENTDEIILESANFDRVNIRKTAMEFGLRTDSSARFEKGQDPNNAELGLKRAVELIKQVCPKAEVTIEVVDKSNFELDQGPIEITHDYIQSKIGAEISQEKITDILTSLEFEVEQKEHKFLVTVPTFRATVDITQKEDLVEEIARIYGYNEIESSLPKFKIEPAEVSELKQLEKNIKDIMCYQAGYTELKNYSFVSGEIIEKLNKDQSDYIELKNPKAQDKPYLRRELIENLVEKTEQNLEQRESIALFETGKVFRKEQSGEYLTHKKEEQLPQQNLHFSAVFSKQSTDTTFFEIKSALEQVAERLNIELTYNKKNIDSEVYHPGRYGEIYTSGKMIGCITELHPLAQKEFDFEQRVAFFEIDLNKLLETKTEQEVYQKFSDYPAVTRDIAFVVDQEIEHKKLKQIIEQAKLVESVDLFDVYQGENIPEDKKNMAYHLTYRAEDRTLDSKEIDQIQQKIKQKLQEKFHAELRE